MLLAAAHRAGQLVTAFGKGVEWANSGMMQVQYHGIKCNALDQFKGMETQTVVAGPKGMKTGNVIYPYEKAKQ